MINLRVSVVVPLLDEESNILIFYRGIKSTLDYSVLSYEIIFVDDGSIDGTFKILEALSRVDNNLIIISLAKKSGQSAALAAGFKFATGDIIVTMDGDMQHDPKDIINFLIKINHGYDIVCGWRRVDSLRLFICRFASIIANKLGAVIFGLSVHDFSCSFRAYKRVFLKDLYLAQGFHRFMPVLAKFKDMAIGEVKINYKERARGKSKYSLLRFPAVIRDAILLKISELFLAKAYPSLFKEICPGADMICLKEK